MNWTESELKKWLKAGTIKGYEIINKNGPAVKMPIVKKEAKQVTWMRKVLLELQMVLKYKVEEEYKFHAKRKCRADFALPELKVLIEYEGIQSEKARHTTLKGYTGDSDKYNEAQKLGWIVLRYTVLNYKSVVIDIKNVIRDRIVTI